MSMGYFIHVGDKTSCGGTVLGGDQGWIADGRPRARQGDPVSCGEDGETYAITGGISYILLNGQLAAGTLDSLAGCPCKAILIPSILWAGYSNRSADVRTGTAQTLARAPMPVSAPITPAPERVSAILQTSLSPTSSSALPHPSENLPPQEPGFYIVPKTTTRSALYSALFESPNFKTMTKFHVLNPGSEVFKAGSMIVLSDPDHHQCSREEALLMEAAATVNQTLESLSAEEADFLAAHREEISTFLSYSSTSVGVGTAVYATHLNDVKSLLNDLESLHHREFRQSGNLRSAKFFAERKELLTRLDLQLGSWTRKGVGISDHPKLKSALGISSRSLVHHWKNAGAPSQIPGYATHLDGVATVSKIIKAGGWAGIALGAGASYLNVQDVCAAGNAEACRRIKFTQTGGFAGGVVAGLASANILVKGAKKVCIGIGKLGTVGRIACGLVVVATGSYAAGKGGEMLGEYHGELIYEASE